MFTSPWCTKCSEMDPDFIKAAFELSKLNPPVFLAKIDAPNNRRLTEKYKVKSFPFFFLFLKGKQAPYFKDHN